MKPDAPLGDAADDNPWDDLIDPGFYLEANPDLASAGIDPVGHFALVGRFELRPANALVDKDYYHERYADVRRDGQHPLVHYCRYGWREGRDPGPFFDTDFYLASHPDVARSGVNPLIHFVRQGLAERRAPYPGCDVAGMLHDAGIRQGWDLVRLFVSRARAASAWSELVDPGFYLARNPDVAAASRDPLDHFRTSGCFEARPANPLLDHDFYLSQPSGQDQPPAEAARNSLIDYCELGWHRGRNPGPFFDTAFYLARNPEVRRSGVNPLLHFVRHGLAEGRAPYEGCDLTRVLAGAGDRSGWDLVHYFVARAERRPDASDGPPAPDPAASYLPLPIDPAAEPVVSVIIPVMAQRDLTPACLDSIARAWPSLPVEVIIVDESAPDKAPAALDRRRDLRFVRNRAKAGLIDCCNAGAAAARGSLLVFLDNATEVQPGWLDALVSAASRDPSVGLVGAQILGADGRLRLAGGIIRQEGGALDWGCGGSPAARGCDFDRDVDYAAGTAILVPRRLFLTLGGFDPRYRPAGCEDIDLAFRVRAMGLRVVYTAAARVIWVAGASKSRDPSQAINFAQLQARWRSVLASQDRGEAVAAHAEDRAPLGRALVVDVRAPTSDGDPASACAMRLIGLLAGWSYRVTFFPDPHDVSFRRFGGYPETLKRQGVECVAPPSTASLAAFLEERGEDFDLVVLTRPEVTARHVETVRRRCPGVKLVADIDELRFLHGEAQAGLAQLLAELGAPPFAGPCPVCGEADGYAVEAVGQGWRPGQCRACAATPWDRAIAVAVLTALGPLGADAALATLGRMLPAGGLVGIALDGIVRAILERGGALRPAVRSDGTEGCLGLIAGRPLAGIALAEAAARLRRLTTETPGAWLVMPDPNPGRPDIDTALASWWPLSSAGLEGWRPPSGSGRGLLGPAAWILTPQKVEPSH